MTTDGFGNGLNDRYKVFFEDPETRNRDGVIMDHNEITAHRTALAGAKFSDLIPLKGVGMVQKSAFKGEKKIEASGAKKDFSHVVQYGHGSVNVPGKEAGYKVERINYRGEEMIYTQIAFCPKKVWDTKSADDHQGWIEKAIKNDQK